MGGLFSRNEYNGPPCLASKNMEDLLKKLVESALEDNNREWNLKSQEAARSSAMEMSVVKKQLEETKGSAKVLKHENKKLKEKTRKMEKCEENRVRTQMQLDDATKLIAKREKELKDANYERDEMKLKDKQQEKQIIKLKKKATRVETEVTRINKTLNLRQVRYCSMDAFLDGWKKVCPQLGLDDASKLFSFHLQQLSRDEIDKLPIPLHDLKIILDAWDVYRERGNAEAHQRPATEEEFNKVYDGLIDDLKKCMDLSEGTVSHWKGLKHTCWQKVVEEKENLVERVAKSKKKREAVLSPSKKR